MLSYIIVIIATPRIYTMFDQFIVILQYNIIKHRCIMLPYEYLCMNYQKKKPYANKPLLLVVMHTRMYALLIGRNDSTFSVQKPTHCTLSDVLFTPFPIQIHNATHKYRSYIQNRHSHIIRFSNRHTIITFSFNEHVGYSNIL